MHDFETIGLDKVEVGGRIFNRMQDEMRSYFKNLNEVAHTVNDRIEGLLKTKSNEIAASEKFGAIYDRFPSIRMARICWRRACRSRT